MKNKKKSQRCSSPHVQAHEIFSKYKLVSDNIFIRYNERFWRGHNAEKRMHASLRAATGNFKIIEAGQTMSIRAYSIPGAGAPTFSHKLRAFSHRARTRTAAV